MFTTVPTPVARDIQLHDHSKPTTLLQGPLTEEAEAAHLLIYD